jgi:hypothetical protein
VLFLTWNIANLGVQRRRDKDYRLLAEASAGSTWRPSRSVTTTLSASRRGRRTHGSDRLVERVLHPLTAESRARTLADVCIGRTRGGGP